MTGPQAASHPAHCPVCHGTGWQDGPNIQRPTRTYTTAEPCTHDWWHDEPAHHDYVPFERGIHIAWQAHVDECRHLGKEPSRARFDRWIR